MLAGRAVRKMVRRPEQFFDVTLQPALFLIIFVYVLGGAMAGSTHDYLQYVLPGIMIQTVLFSTVSIGVNLTPTSRKASFDRFRSLPIARSAPLIGAVIAEGLRYSLTIVMSLAIGFLMGYRTTTGVLGVSPPTCWPCSSPGACAGSRSGSGWCRERPARFRASASW